MKGVKISYSKRTLKSINTTKLRKDIIDSIESSPQLRKEIARVFQKANRRIQNVKNAGMYSPAVESVSRGKSGYSVFNMQGDWQALKREYGKAVAFLNQPTSTASGARDYKKAIKARYDLKEVEYEALKDEYLKQANSLSGSDFVEKYLKRYKDLSGDFESVISDTHNQIELESKESAQRLQDDINKTADEVVNRIAGAVDNFFDNMENLADSLDVPF